MRTYVQGLPELYIRTHAWCVYTWCFKQRDLHAYSHTCGVDTILAIPAFILCRWLEDLDSQSQYMVFIDLCMTDGFCGVAAAS